MSPGLNLLDRPSAFPMVTLRTVLVSLPLIGCHVIHGSGQLVEEDRKIGDFERIVLEGEGRVEFTQGERRRLTLEAEDNIAPELVTKVERGTLVLGVRSGALLDPTLPIIYRLENPELLQVSMDGSGDFDCEELVSDDLAVRISGSGNVRFDALETEHLSIEVNGSGDVAVHELTGSAARVDLSGSGSVGLAGEVDTESILISGSGSFLGIKLEADTAKVRIDGSGDVEVFARQTLDIDISGSGNVRFKGEPSLSSSISGSGNVTSLD